MNQKSAPIYEALEHFRKKRVVPFDVPGHKRGRGNPELVEAKTVFDAAAAGDETGLKLLDGYTTILSEGLTNLINIFQPAYLCIGGGVSKAGDALLVPLKEKIRSRLYSKNAKKNTQIVLARLNNDAGILGAALLEK